MHAIVAVGGVLAIAVTTLWLAAVSIAARLRAPRATPGWTPPSVLEVAFLVGGPRRVVDTVISTMHEDERAQVTGDQRLEVLRPVAANSVEREVIAACSPGWEGDLGQVCAAVVRSPAVQGIGDGLASYGMLRPPGPTRHHGLAAWAQRWACILTCVVLFAVTAFAARPDADYGPFSFLSVFLIALAGVVIGVLLRPRGRLTPAGKDVVARLRRANPWIREGVEASGPAVSALVAIGGPRLLPAGPLRDELLAAGVAAGGQRGSRRSGSSSHSSFVAPGDVAWCGSAEGGGGGCGASSCGGSSCGGGSGGGGSSCGGGGGGGGGGGCGGGGGGGSG